MSKVETVPKKQCAMLVYAAERDHKKNLFINAIVSGTAVVVVPIAPLLGAAILIGQLGYNIFRMKQQDKKIQYLRDRYGLG